METIVDEGDKWKRWWMETMNGNDGGWREWIETMMEMIVDGNNSEWKRW